MIIDSINKFCFAHPWWLIALIPVLFFLLLYTGYNSWEPYFKKAKVRPRYCQSKLSHKISWLLPPLLLYCTLVVILAGPLWKKKTPLPVNAPVVVLVDASRHNPVLPSMLRNLITAIKQSSVGIIVYSGSAHVLSPVTQDKNGLILLSEAVSAEIMPVKGSRPDLAVQEGIKLLRQSHHKEGRLLLMTSTMDKHNALQLMQLSSKYNQPFDIIDTSCSKKNSFFLQSIVKETSGNYLKIKSRDELPDLATIYQNEYQEFGSALLPLALIGMLLMCRKIVFNSALVLLLGIATFNITPKATAASTDNYAYFAKRALVSKDYSSAALYFGKLRTATGYYNQGNAYAKNLQFEKAVQAYDQVLKIVPDHEDAQFNRQLILNFFVENKTTVKSEKAQITHNTHTAKKSGTASALPQIKSFLKRKFLIEVQSKKQ